MADQNKPSASAHGDAPQGSSGLTAAGTTDESSSFATADVKGKGRASDVLPDADEDDEDDDEDDDDDDDDDDEVPELDAKEELEENNPSGAGEGDGSDIGRVTAENIIQGERRTRGKRINYAKAAEEAGDDLEPDEDEDEDYEMRDDGQAGQVRAEDRMEE